VRALRKRRPDLPVSYMSGYPGDELAEEPVGPEMAFLQKPFTPDALAAAVREVLGRR